MPSSFPLHPSPSSPLNWRTFAATNPFAVARLSPSLESWNPSHHAAVRVTNFSDSLIFTTKLMFIMSLSIVTSQGKPWCCSASRRSPQCVLPSPRTCSRTRSTTIAAASVQAIVRSSLPHPSLILLPISQLMHLFDLSRGMDDPQSGFGAAMLIARLIITPRRCRLPSPSSPTIHNPNVRTTHSNLSYMLIYIRVLSS
jgi:hypothetical protein